jgi:hypothetical protein
MARVVTAKKLGRIPEPCDEQFVERPGSGSTTEGSSLGLGPSLFRGRVHLSYREPSAWPNSWLRRGQVRWTQPKGLDVGGYRNTWTSQVSPITTSGA